MRRVLRYNGLSIVLVSCFVLFWAGQSEFLAIAAVVLLSIVLRQRGSPESKPVDAPYSETGGG